MTSDGPMTGPSSCLCAAAWRLTLRPCLPWTSSVSALTHNARDCLVRSWRHWEAVSPGPIGAPFNGDVCPLRYALSVPMHPLALRVRSPRRWTDVLVVRTGSDSRRAVSAAPLGPDGQRVVLPLGPRVSGPGGACCSTCFTGTAYGSVKYWHGTHWRLRRDFLAHNQNRPRSGELVTPPVDSSG